MLNDIIQDAYVIIMKRKTSHDKLEVLRRFLKQKYNISVTRSTLEKRDAMWSKKKEL
jgi:hypothetical protein